MYILLVRPNIEYANQVWSPYKIGEVNSIESVQKFALRMCHVLFELNFCYIIICILALNFEPELLCIM
jgi:hypothetical protein